MYVYLGRHAQVFLLESCVTDDGTMVMNHCVCVTVYITPGVTRYAEYL